MKVHVSIDVRITDLVEPGARETVLHHRYADSTVLGVLPAAPRRAATLITELAGRTLGTLVGDTMLEPVAWSPGRDAPRPVTAERIQAAAIELERALGERDITIPESASRIPRAEWLRWVAGCMLEATP